MLLTLTSLTTCSVADCERQHANHKVLASTGNNTSFISLMVNSTNDQAKNAFLALQRRAQKHVKDNHPNLLMDKPEKRKLEATITSSTGPSQSSRASAISIFRKQYIHSKMIAGERPVNWCSASAWKEVKESFNRLTEEQANHYKKLALCVNSRRRLGKKLEGSSKHMEVRPSEIATTQLSVGTGDCLAALAHAPRVWNVLLFTCEAFQDIDSFDGFKTVLADRLLRLGSSKQLDPCPITEANVLSALMSLRCRGIQIRDAVTHLSRTCQFLAGPKTENEFPKQVQYQRSCQGVCCNTFGFKFLQLQTGIVKVLHDLAAGYKKPSDMVKQDVLLCFDIFVQGEAVYSEFYLVTAVAFRGGVQQPVESYTRLQVVRDGDDVFLHLSASNNALSPGTKWPHPIERAVAFGSIQTLSTVQLAAHIAKLNDDDSGLPHDCPPHKVVIQEFDYRDCSRTVLQLKDPVGQAIVIDTKDLDKGGKQTVPDSKSTSSKSKSRSEHFLSVFDDDGEQGPKPRATKHSAARDVNEAQDDTYNYNSVHEEVFLQMLEALELPIDEDYQNNLPKWKRDFAGVLDPDNLEALHQEHKRIKIFVVQQFVFKGFCYIT